MNAANEVAVASFLDGKLKFLDIAAITEQVLESAARLNGPSGLGSLDDAMAADGQARRLAEEYVAARAAA